MDQTLNLCHSNIDDFNLFNGSVCPKQLRVMQWNVRGINDFQKFQEILLAVDHLVTPIDVIIIGETWLKAENTALYTMIGYKHIFSSRESSSGGLAMFVRDTIKYNVVKNTCSDGFHHIHAELLLPVGVFDVHAVYRPPSYDFNSFHDCLETWLNNSNTNRPCLIFGDMNVPVNLSNNNTVLKYTNLLQSYGFICTNTFVTRPCSSNILDHVICKMDDAHRLRNHTILNELSDHCLILSEFEIHFDKSRIELSKKVINHEKLENEFKTYIDSIEPIQDVNTCLQDILSKYNTILKNCKKKGENPLKSKVHNARG